MSYSENPLDFRGYRIIGTKQDGPEEIYHAAGQFAYRGYIISFSTHHPNDVNVAVWEQGKPIEKYFTSVEEAIFYINRKED